MDKETLLYERTNAWQNKTDKIMGYCEGYKKYLDNSKTEREAALYTEELAAASGFVSLDEIIKKGIKPEPGDKIYKVFHKKCVVLFVIGRKSIECGLNITASHIDSPRLDIKQNPLYEDSSLALMKTHYYGGIKKYQWTAVPLALHGVITNAQGETYEINIGDDENDPVFFVSDLLIHLSAQQLQKTAATAITGEQLNIIVGNIPFENEEEEVKECVKYNVLKLLNEKYGITEKDFLFAEIEAVPSQKAKDAGFDRSFVCSYGQDDKVCAYPALSALFSVEIPELTCACILTDKEEIGNAGTTGIDSMYFENMLTELIAAMNNGCEYISVRRALANSKVLSMDVCCAYDPSFPDAFDKSNTALAGGGAILIKYTGARGKSGSNDAHSEFLTMIRKAFDEAEVAYQTGELGKVDQGGGGTVASSLCRYGGYTVDFGVPVLAMHAPMELVSKADVYAAHMGAKVFYEMA